MKFSQILTVVFVACLLVSAVPASAAAQNYKLGVQSGTTSDTYAAENLPNAQVSGFDSIDLAIEALKQGDVDFVLGDLPTLKFYQADSDGLTIAGEFSEEDFGIGVAPGESDLLAAINVGLVLPSDHDSLIEEEIDFISSGLSWSNFKFPHTSISKSALSSLNLSASEEY